MPALPPVAKTLQIAARQSFGGDTDIINRFFIQYSGSAPTASDLTTFAGAVDTSWGSHIAPVTANGLGVDLWTITDLSSSTSPQVEVPSTQFGTDTDTPLPPNEAVVVSSIIGRRYRGGHPRTYLAGRTEAQLSAPGSRIWSTAFEAAMNSAWAAFMSGIGAAPWSGAGSLLPVNVSYFEGFTNVLYPSGRYHAVPTRRATPVTDQITAWRINPRVCSQRRRTSGE